MQANKSWFELRLAGQKKIYNVNDLVKIAIWVGVIGAAFAFARKQGYLLRLSNYVAETREELKKCTWPTWDELKGSTLVVFVSILLLGAFTVIIDRIFFQLMLWLT